MRKIVVFFLILIGIGTRAFAQSIHFSQFFNAPHLINPANTGLMPEYDYRVGANYRNQWTVLPVPFTTVSGFADVKLGGNRSVDHPNWFGLGGSVFSDKAGDGSLSLLQVQGAIAYHLHLSSKSLLSFGGSAAYVQRSVNMDNLTFDSQWDGFSFNERLPNGEKLGLLKTNFTTINAGANLSFFLNEAVYIKLGVGVNNVNQPVETFYNTDNTIKMRPIANLDVVYRTGPDFIVNPSVYYTTQANASEIVFGTLTRFHLSQVRDAISSELLIGAYHRIGDAMIGAAGYQYGGLQILASYDFTVSDLSPHNASYGALEFSLIYGSTYFKNQGVRKMYSCPRFN